MNKYHGKGKISYANNMDYISYEGNFKLNKKDG